MLIPIINICELEVVAKNMAPYREMLGEKPEHINFRVHSSKQMLLNSF